jgi:hypothetical protein
MYNSTLNRDRGDRYDSICYDTAAVRNDLKSIRFHMYQLCQQSTGVDKSLCDKINGSLDSRGPLPIRHAKPIVTVDTVNL